MVNSIPSGLLFFKQNRLNIGSFFPLSVHIPPRTIFSIEYAYGILQLLMLPYETVYYTHVVSFPCFCYNIPFLFCFSFSFAIFVGFSVSDENAPVTITITEDLSTPVDEDDFVKYYGLEKHTEQGSAMKL